MGQLLTEGKGGSWNGRKGREGKGKGRKGKVKGENEWSGRGGREGERNLAYTTFRTLRRHYVYANV